jgi:hypothetical protein
MNSSITTAASIEVIRIKHTASTNVVIAISFGLVVWLSSSLTMNELLIVIEELQLPYGSHSLPVLDPTTASFKMHLHLVVVDSGILVVQGWMFAQIVNTLGCFQLNITCVSNRDAEVTISVSERDHFFS